MLTRLIEDAPGAGEQPPRRAQPGERAALGRRLRRVADRDVRRRRGYQVVVAERDPARCRPRASCTLANASLEERVAEHDLALHHAPTGRSSASRYIVVTTFRSPLVNIIKASPASSRSSAGRFEYYIGGDAQRA